MADHNQSMTINASAETIFDFVADVSNLPKYLPTTKSAQPQGEERVRIQGGGEGFQYDADGYLRPDRDNLRLEWGADERYYSGWLQIEAQGDNSTTVTVQVSFNAPMPGSSPEQGPSDANIREGLQAALQSIQNHVEGDGGKVEPDTSN